MAEELPQATLAEMTSEIVCAYASHNQVAASELATLVGAVAGELRKVGISRTPTGCLDHMRRHRTKRARGAVSVSGFASGYRSQGFRPPPGSLAAVPAVSARTRERWVIRMARPSAVMARLSRSAMRRSRS
jgi:ROS/MUCR transcriptional regulator protein